MLTCSNLLVCLQGPEELRKVPGIKQLVESILPYSERHYARLERLQKASYLLDYTLRAMKTATAGDAGLKSAVQMQVEDGGAAAGNLDIHASD